MKTLLPLAFLVLLSSCSLYKLTVSTDTYALEEAHGIKIDSIFIDNKPAEKDLSLLLISQSIATEIEKLGIQTSSSEESPYRITYQLSSSGPIPRTSQSTSEGKTSSTITKENEEGEEEEYTVESKVSYPVYRHYVEFQHKLKVKLFRAKDGKLVWQSESVVEETEQNPAMYSRLLVYTALQNFLKNSSEHPKKQKFSKQSRTKINRMFETR